MLAAVNDRAHSAHETFAEWLVEDFDAAAFDMAGVNQVLRRIS